MASRSGCASAPRRRRTCFSRARSTTRTVGSGAAAWPFTGTRSGIFSSVYLPMRALWTLSKLGVALPSTHTAPAKCARTTATSRAW